jgi:hypothetical protein
MEMSHGNSLCNYLKQTKCHFLKTNLENRGTEHVLSGMLVPVGEGRMWGNGVGG